MSTISQAKNTSNLRERSVYRSNYCWTNKGDANERLDSSITDLDLLKMSFLSGAILRKIINYQKTRAIYNDIEIDLSRSRFDTNEALATYFKVSERNIKYAMLYLKTKDLIVTMTVQGSRKREYALSVRLINYLSDKDFTPFTVLNEVPVTVPNEVPVTVPKEDRVTVLYEDHRVSDLERVPSKGGRGSSKLSLPPDFLKSMNPVLGYHPDISVKNNLIRDLVSQYGIDTIVSLRDSVIKDRTRFTWGEDANPRETDLPVEEISDYLNFLSK